MTRRRRIRLIVLALLIPAAVVAWQASQARSVTVQSAIAQRHLASSEAADQLARAIANASNSMESFYRSGAFDTYVSWYSTHDSEYGPSRMQLGMTCDRAKGTVFLPPFTGEVTRGCSTLDDVTTPSLRALAFGPVLLEYVRRCRSGREIVERGGNPYTPAQWVDLTKQIDMALKADCKNGVSRGSGLSDGAGDGAGGGAGGGGTTNAQAQSS